MSKKVSSIKEKIIYEKGKVSELQKKIRKMGGNFSAQLLMLDVNLQIIKDILFEEKRITEDEFELRYLKNVQVILKKISEEIKEARRKNFGLIIPKARIPKDLKGFKA